MREALSVIADVRESERLRQFLATGTDRTQTVYWLKLLPLLNVYIAGEPTHVTATDMPRGLNQLGNTCYLNSLLQVSPPRVSRL